MALHENVSALIAYKAHTSGEIDPTAEPDLSTSPGASGATYLRRTSSSLNLTKDTFESNEVNASRQVTDFRHGTRRVNGDIQGELSPGTYADFIEAVMRGTRDTTVSITEATVGMSSATLSIASNVITASAGSFITSGLKVGDVIRLGTGFLTANKNKNLRITALTATTLTLVGATLTNEAGPLATYIITRPGKKLVIPTSAHVKRLFAIEHHYSDGTTDHSQLFTECRIGKWSVNAPASGIATTTFGVSGRNMQTYAGGAAPFFSTPAAAPSTSVVAGASGSLIVNGAAVAVITGFDVSLDLSPASEPVLGSVLVPDIFLGRAKVGGNITAFFEDTTLLDYFLNETAVSLALRLDADSTGGGDFLSVYLPKIKFGGATIQRSGEGGMPISLPFTALKPTSAAGTDESTIVVQDSSL